MLGIIGVLIGSIIVGSMLYQRRVIQVAQKYLSQTYTQEMQYLRVGYNFIVDSFIHRVYFFPMNNPDLVFVVGVSTMLEVQEPHIYDGYAILPDNYYTRHFEMLLEDYFEEDIAQIWGHNARIGFFASQSYPFSSKISNGFDIQLPLEKMEPLFSDYHLFVYINQNYKNISRDDEAQKIFGFIENVRNSGYTPKRITFRYLPVTSINSDDLVVVVFDDWDDWMEIKTVNQVLEKMT